MGLEIERKFLVVGDGYRRLAPPVRYRQGYLNFHRDRTVRVRVAGGRGFLTVKGRTVGATRAEYEYEIPPRDAEEMLAALCEGSLVEKDRYRVEAGALAWEVDEFLGDNAGLVVAEIELGREDQPFDRPDWVGAEVTGDSRYSNSHLARRPFRDWGARPGPAGEGRNLPPAKTV